MSQIQDDLSYLSKTTGARPAGTEEENQAGLYIQRQFEANKNFETSTEEFASVPSPDFIPLICFGASAVFTLLAMLFHVFTGLAFVVALAGAVLYVLEILDIPVLSRLFQRGLTQNIVAKYKPEGANKRARKIILVANYDSEKNRPELTPTVAPYLPILQKASLGGLVALPIIWLIRLFAGVPAGSVGWNVVTCIALVLVLITVIISALHMTSGYNEGANDNASGVAVMLEIARQIANGQIVDKPKPQRDIDGRVIHGEAAARDAGAVPEGATLTYTTEENDPEAQLNAAKAAVANLTGKAVDGIKPGQKMGEFVKPKRVHVSQEDTHNVSRETNNLNHQKQSQEQEHQNTNRQQQGDIENDRTQVIERPAGTSTSDQKHPDNISYPNTLQSDESSHATMHSTQQQEKPLENKTENKETHSDQMGFQKPVPEGMTRTSQGDVVPSWFAEAQRKAGSNGKTPIAVDGHSNVRRSRYADAFDAAEKTIQTQHPKFVPSASIQPVKTSAHPDSSEILDSKQKSHERHENAKNESAPIASHESHGIAQNEHHNGKQESYSDADRSHVTRTQKDDSSAVKNQSSSIEQRQRKENSQQSHEASDDEPMTSAAEESRRRLAQYGFKPRKRTHASQTQPKKNVSHETVPPQPTQAQAQSERSQNVTTTHASDVSRETSARSGAQQQSSEQNIHAAVSVSSNKEPDQSSSQQSASQQSHVSHKSDQSQNDQGTAGNVKDMHMSSPEIHSQATQVISTTTSTATSAPATSQTTAANNSQPQNETDSATLQEQAERSENDNQPMQSGEYAQNNAYDGQVQEHRASAGKRITNEVEHIADRVKSSHAFHSLKHKISDLTHRDDQSENSYDAFQDDTLNSYSGQESGYDSVYHGDTAQNAPADNETNSLGNQTENQQTGPHDAYTGMPIAEEDSKEQITPVPASRDATQAMPHIDVSDKVTNYSIENDANAEARKLQSQPSRKIQPAPRQTSNRVVFDETNTPVSKQEDEIDESLRKTASMNQVPSKPSIHSNIGKVIPRISQNDKGTQAPITQKQAAETVRQIVASTPQKQTNQQETLQRPEETKQRAPIFDMQTNKEHLQTSSLKSGAIPRISISSSQAQSGQNSASASTSSTQNMPLNKENTSKTLGQQVQSQQQQTPAQQQTNSVSSTMLRTNLANLPTMSGRITNEKSVTNVQTAGKQQPANMQHQPHVQAQNINQQVASQVTSQGGNVPSAQDQSGMYVNDTEDSEQPPSTGAFADISIPKEHKGLFGKLRNRREKKRQQEDADTASKWLDVDEDFNPTKVGAERGGWESFQPDAEKSNKKGTSSHAPSSRTSSKNPHTDDSWNGGAYSQEHAHADEKRMVDSTQPLPSYIPQSKGDTDPTGRIPLQNAHQSNDASDEVSGHSPAQSQVSSTNSPAEQNQSQAQAREAEIDKELNSKFHDDQLVQDEQKITDDMDRIQEVEQKDILRMRPHLSTEVWFVALGSELSNNSGSKAFLERHKDELRGSIIVNLEALGEGELTYVDEEGSIVTVKASSRMKRLVNKAIQDSGVEVAQSGKLDWKNSIVSIARRYHLQGMSIVGMEQGKPALMGEADDREENVSTSKLERAVKFVAGLVRSI